MENLDNTSFSPADFLTGKSTYTTDDNIGNTPTVNPLDAAINKAFLTTNSKPTNEFAPTYYNPDVKERFAEIPTIYNEHFDPKADNERLAAENWTTWDALSAGLGGFKDTFSASFKEGAATWPKVGQALLYQDASYLMDNELALQKKAYEIEKSSIENPIFYTPNTEDDILTKGFLAESFSNLGFTLGTLSEVMVEQAATKFAEALLTSTGAGAGAAAGLEAAEDVSTASKLKNVWSGLTKLFTGAAVDGKAGGAFVTLENTGLQVIRDASGNALKSPTLFELGNKQFLRTLNTEANTALRGVESGVDIWDNALKVASKLPIVGQLADAGRLIKVAKAGELTAKELMSIGAGGLRRSFAEWQMAAGEAAIEAGGNYKDLSDKLIDEYKLKNGSDPTGAALQGIKDLALKSSTADFGTNVAILAITNKIAFGNALSAFKFDSKVMLKLADYLGGDAAKELGILSVESAGKTRLYQKGLLGTLGVLPKIASDFNKTKAAWEFGGSLIKGLTKVEISEGIQENLQETTTQTLQNYYTDIYRRGAANFGKSLQAGLESQYSKQGFKTFLSGALTGLFTHPVIRSVHYAAEKGGFSPAAVAHREAVEQSIKVLNTFYSADDNVVLSEAFKQVKLQHMFNNNMLSAISQKDKHQYYNNQDSALIQLVMHAKRTGTMDYLKSFIDGYGNKFSEKEFEEAFKFSPKEFGTTPQEIASNVSNFIDKYSKLYDKYQEKFGLYLKLGDLINDPAGKEKFSIKQAALMDYITTVSFLEAKAGRSLERSADILSKLTTKYPSIGQSLSSAFNTVVSPDNLTDQLVILQGEIRNLSDSSKENPSDKTIQKALDDKKEEYSYLDLFLRTMYQENEIEDPNNPARKITTWDVNDVFRDESFHSIIAEYLTKYLDLKNKQFGRKITISDSEVTDAMKDIYDYISLGQDHIQYTEAVNMLNNPKNIEPYHSNLMNARVSARARLLYDDYQNLASLSAVAKQFVDENKNVLDELLAFSKAPYGSYKNLITLQVLRNKLSAKAEELSRTPAPAPATPVSAPAATSTATPAAAAPTPAASTPSAPVTATTITKTPEEIAKEEEEKKNRSEESKKPIDIFGLLDQDKDVEVSAFMQMRYDYDELENTFPFDETDVSKRKVNRYYIDPDGNKVLGNSIDVPYKIKFADGTITTVDNFNDLLDVLYQFEQDKYDMLVKNKSNISNKQSETKIKNADQEKQSLKNFIGNSVILDGKAGILQKDAKGYYVEFSDNKRSEISPETINNREPLFSDFINLSLNTEKLPDEKKEIVKDDEAFSSWDYGEVSSISLNKDLSTVNINGIDYQINKDDNGLAIGFTGEIEVEEDGKVISKILTHQEGSEIFDKYASRVNNIIMAYRKAFPETKEELEKEIVILEEAIGETKQIISEESPIKRKRDDEVAAENQVHELLEPSVTVAYAIDKWKHGFHADEDLEVIYEWATELRDKILNSPLKNFKGNNVYEDTLSMLNNEYINPLSQLLNVTTKSTPKAQRSTNSEETIAQQLAKTSESKESKSDTTESSKKSESSKESGNLKEAVNDALLTGEMTTQPILSTETPDEVMENIPVENAEEMTLNVDDSTVNNISSLFETTSSIVTDTETKSDINKTDINPFDDNTKTYC